MKGALILAVAVVFGLAGCKPPKTEANRRLLEACAQSRLKGVKDALADGADPNALDPNPDRGFSAIEESVETPEIVDALLKAGASATKQDSGGFLPIGIAAAAGKLETLELLIKAGAKIDDKDGSGETALASAVTSGNYDNALYLVAVGANVNTADNIGFTPLFHAVMGLKYTSKSRIKMVQFLIQSGADLSAKDSKGRTAAFYAKTKIAKTLGADKQLVDLLTPHPANQGQKPPTQKH